MKKYDLLIATQNFKTETREALQTLFNSVNKGQQKQLVKKEEIKKLFDKYNVDY